MSLNKKSQKAFNQHREELADKIFQIQSVLHSAKLVFGTLEVDGKPSNSVKFKRDFFQTELDKYEKEMQQLINDNPEWLI